MTLMYLIRHAEAEGNVYRRIHGWYDSRITETGMRQIAALEHRFQNVHVDAVYASDLRRTQMTAQAVVRPKGLELHIEPGLKEISMGIYEDRTFGDLAFHDPEHHKLFYTCSPLWNPEKGETYAQVCERVYPTLLRIAAAHPNETLAVFSHGTAIRCAISAAWGKHPFETTSELVHFENTSVSCLEIENGSIHVRFYNDASHLPEEIATVALQKKAVREGYPSIETWFRSLDMERDESIYYEARKDAWENIHGSLHAFDGPRFVQEARSSWKTNPRSVQCVMYGSEIIGLLHTDTTCRAAEGIGFVPFVYLKPNYRRKGIGVQLIGEAVSLYRALGRKCLRLRCAPDNHLAQRFYHRYGFRKIGETSETGVLLDWLEKEI